MKKILLTTEYFEDDYTLSLMKEMKVLRKQGYVTKSQLIKILKWKSPRPLRFYTINDEKFIKEVTTSAFKAQNDILKIHMLTALAGVNYPSASAILMFYDSKKFPVLDIRVWQQLYTNKIVDGNRRGANFSLRNCSDYFKVIRELAANHNLTARQIEKKIFLYDQLTRKGNLY